MKNSKKKLYLATGAFPYGLGEKTFILPELSALKKVFDITIITNASQKTFSMKEHETILDDDIKLIRIDKFSQSKLSFIKYFFRFWSQKECLDELEDIKKNPKMILRKLIKSIEYYARAEFFYDNIVKSNIIDPNAEGVYYSYWYNERVLGMAMHRDNHPNLKVVTRAHGFDLYDERIDVIQRQPFKNVIDSKLDKVVFISKHGHDYYVNKYTKDGQTLDKYKIWRIGVRQQVENISTEKHTPFLLVSCSMLKKIKRVDYIIKALAMIEEYPIHWVHFGSGSCQDELYKLAEEQLGPKSNITYEFKGFTENGQILEYYKEEKPDCFITTSATEGSPVSMQEALAFGMPVVGTAVGGIPEMIDGNGVLLHANPETVDVGRAIEKVVKTNKEEYKKMCLRSFEIWRCDYNQEVNMYHFVTMLDNL